MTIDILLSLIENTLIKINCKRIKTDCTVDLLQVLYNKTFKIAAIEVHILTDNLYLLAIFLFPITCGWILNTWLVNTSCQSIFQHS